MKVCSICGVRMEDVYTFCSECSGKLAPEAEAVNLRLSVYLKYEARQQGLHTKEEFRLFSSSINGVRLTRKWFAEHKAVNK